MLVRTVVEDDLVTMWVSVKGSENCDTTMCGSATAPKGGGPHDRGVWQRRIAETPSRLREETPRWKEGVRLHLEDASLDVWHARGCR